MNKKMHIDTQDIDLVLSHTLDSMLRKNDIGFVFNIPDKGLSEIVKDIIFEIAELSIQEVKEDMLLSRITLIAYTINDEWDILFTSLGRRPSVSIDRVDNGIDVSVSYKGDVFIPKYFYDCKYKVSE